MIDLYRLTDALKVAGLPTNISRAEPHVTETPASFHQRPDGWVRIDWPSPPTQAQIDQAEAIVQAHDGTPTADDKLDAAGLPQRVLAATAIRASTGWAALTAQQKAKVQGIIDAGAQTALAKMS